MRTRITCHQESSLTSIFEATTQLAKETEVLVYRLTLVEARISTLERANKALSKCCRAKRTQIHQGEALSIEEAKDLLAQREVDVQIAAD